ncbi:MAG: hypothetical protein GOV15_04295, partial [Candidatus Diapherotrites archaeon]|nr:hypothetical protein [Candidatus Diapherotrites archaeon]
VVVIQGDKPDHAKSAASLRGAGVVKSGRLVGTRIDNLFDLVRDKGFVSLEEAAVRLHLSLNQTEAWSNLLESRGLIDILYPTIGSPELRVRGLEVFAEEKIEVSAEKVSKRPTTVDEVVKIKKVDKKKGERVKLSAWSFVPPFLRPKSYGSENTVKEGDDDGNGK